MRKIAGLLMIVLGGLQALWVGYNLFIKRLPEFQDPIMPVGYFMLSSALIAMGQRWMRVSRFVAPVKGQAPCPACRSNHAPGDCPLSLHQQPSLKEHSR